MSDFSTALFTAMKISTSEGSPFQTPNLLSSISSWFCPRISLGGRSSLCHRGFPPRQAAFWWGRPSVPGAPRRTRGASTRPCRGTRCTRCRTPACTAGWRRMSAPAAPRDPWCASWAGPAGSSLEASQAVVYSIIYCVIFYFPVFPAELQSCCWGQAEKSLVTFESDDFEVKLLSLCSDPAAERPIPSLRWKWVLPRSFWASNPLCKTQNTFRAIYRFGFKEWARLS